MRRDCDTRTACGRLAVNVSEDDPLVTRLVGALQILGGGFEAAMGMGALAVGGPLGIVGGVLLVSHGTDTIVAGFRSVLTGEVTPTLTHQLVEGTAKGLGASSKLADGLGVAADLGLGVGPSLAMSAVRRLAMAGASQSMNTLSLAHLRIPGLLGARGYSSVATGIRRGSRVSWYHQVGGQFMQVRTLRPGPVRYEHRVIELGITPEQLAAARSSVASSIGTISVWSVFGANHATEARNILQAAGILLPAWAGTPTLLHLGLRAGPEITALAGTVSAGAPTTVR